jgi:hypothetical protein
MRSDILRPIGPSAFFPFAVVRLNPMSARSLIDRYIERWTDTQIDGQTDAELKIQANKCLQISLRKFKEAYSFLMGNNNLGLFFFSIYTKYTMAKL